MVKYLDLIHIKTYEIRNEIDELNRKLENKKLEITKEYFEIDKKAIYRDRDGYIEGEIVLVDGFNITLNVCCVNGSRASYGYQTFKASELNLL